jgi:hypothetical protein
MNLPARIDQAEADVVKARRRERAQALRACRPHERAFLKQLPRSRYAPYPAGEALGISSRTVWQMLNRPRVKRAMAVFIEDAMDQIGVSHTSLVADLAEIRDRCMQAKPVLDRKGMPTGEYQFDATGATAAIKLLMDLAKLTPPKRIEIAGVDGSPIETVTTYITADMEAEEASRVYQELVRTH